MKYQIKSKTQELSLEYNGKEYMLDDKQVLPDIRKTGDRQYSLIIDGKSFYAEIEDVDYANKTISINVNGNTHNLQLADRFDALLDELGFEANSSSKIKELKAPMPGLVIDINVSVGQEVSIDEPLLLLEAMKMENVIKSPGEGVVSAIKIKKGDAVEKNQIMILFE